MAIALFGAFWLPPLLGRLGLLAGVSLLGLWSLIGLSVILGGAFAGAALGRSWRAGLAFALSFPLGLLGLVLLILAGSSLSGREPFLALVGVSVLVFSLGFALIGGIGTLLHGLGWRRAARAAGGGALSGLPGALLFAPPLFAFASLDGGALPWFLVSATVGSLVSALLCGWTLARLQRSTPPGDAIRASSISSTRS